MSKTVDTRGSLLMMKMFYTEAVAGLMAPDYFSKSCFLELVRTKEATTQFHR